MIQKLYYLGKPDDGFGWGVCNQNLVRALGEYFNLIVDDGMTGREEFDAPVFVPIGNEKLEPLRRVKAPRVIGYCFPEKPIHPDAIKNSKLYDVIFAGSTWATRRLVDAGIEANTMIQGVDHDRFFPRPFPPIDERFVVFSGGKFEFRKGQDIVLSAMSEFMARHEDVILTIAWHNPWPETAESMLESTLIDHSDPSKGIPKDRLIVLPKLTNAASALAYSKTHLGLFPNRCEAGTNLVLSEYMASGRHVIATGQTGHADLIGPGNSTPLQFGTFDDRGWFSASVDDVISSLEHCYSRRDELACMGEATARSVSWLSWDSCARKVVQHV